MKYLIRLFAALFIIIVCFSTFSAQQERKKYHSLIKGRVIDEFGQPVANAGLKFIVPEYLSANDLCGSKDFFGTTDKDGNFTVEEHCTQPLRTLYIFITGGDNVQNTIEPISSPFWTALRENNPKFSGLPVNIEENKDVDLGDVAVQVYYNKINLFILDKKGQPYFKNDDQWAEFRLLIRDEKGRDVGSRGLSNRDFKEKIVDVTKGSIGVALPEGTWQLEILASLDDYDNETGKTRRNLAKTTVTIKKGEATRAVRLTVRTKNKVAVK